jgi:hypothetical protein
MAETSWFELAIRKFSAKCAREQVNGNFTIREFIGFDGKTLGMHKKEREK